jgi:murein DD-endopeptidase MepM/ murein hydrolase activator NlpD
MGSLSVERSTTPRDPFSITPAEAASIGAEFGAGASTWLGYYGEPRLIYTEPAFRKGDRKIDDRRTVHLGVEIFAAAGTPVHAPMDATVAFTGVRAAYLDYGGVAILRHETPNGAAFFTLYGHLAPGSLAGLRMGERLAKGELFASLGDISENGGWNPHLHFQLALTKAGFGDDWPGAADPDELFLLMEIFPNPAALLNLADERTAFHTV